MTPNRILFLMQSGHFPEAISLYKEYVAATGKQNSELLEQIGLFLLNQGTSTNDPEIQLLTIFGAGISFNEKALYILKDGLDSRYPQLQLIALGLLAKFQSDEADLALHRAMTSNFLAIRLEGAFHLLSRKIPNAISQTSALMAKVPPQALPLFPQLFALSGFPEATRLLRKLLAHPNEKVRLAAILSTSKYGRDDVLPAIRILSSHTSTVQQEACAMAFGILKDDASMEKLEAFAQSNSTWLQLAAMQALERLGNTKFRSHLIAWAQKEDIFAINILADIPNSENILADLLNSPNTHVKANAALALLKKKDRRCLAMLGKLLVRDSSDLAIGKISSPGKTLTAYKITPSARQNFKEDSLSSEASLCLREEILLNALELPEQDFLELSKVIFESRQSDLIPTLVDSLQMLNTPTAIHLLKMQQQRAGEPLIRNYCNLALYRMKEPGPYAQLIKKWIANQHQEELIQFRPLSKTKNSEEEFAHQLTPQETSRLLIESFEALTQNQDEEGIDILLNAIQKGNSKNKFALAGLLMRASQ